MLRVGHEQGVAIGWRFGHCCCGDGATRALAVDHQELLTQTLGQALGVDAADDVDGAAGRDRSDDLHRLGRIAILR